MMTSRRTIPVRRIPPSILRVCAATDRPTQISNRRGGRNCDTESARHSGESHATAFETLTLDAAMYISKRMRPENIESTMQGIPDLSPDVFAVNCWKTEGAAWHFVQDGIPVAMGGIVTSLPWCGVAWFVACDGITRDSWKKIIRFSRKVFGNARKTIPRIESHCVEGWNMASKYAEAVGFKFEFTRHKATKDGRGMKSYVIFGE